MASTEDPVQSNLHDQEAPSPGSPGAAPLESRVESVIDAGASFDGHIEAANGLRIHGSVTGEIVCRGKLTIEHSAMSNARIDAQECEIYGTVDGDIACAGRLQLGSTAVVTATVRARSLAVEEGALLTGQMETPTIFSDWPRRPGVQPSEDLHAYCMRCRTKQRIADKHRVTMQNGRPAIEGTCAACGIKVFRILSAKETTRG